MATDRRAWVRLVATAALLAGCRGPSPAAAPAPAGAIPSSSVAETDGRATAEATVYGARIRVDYGTPAMRGRDIWGALVPFGELWRTGAGRATHFTTDRDLLMGGEIIPAGTYTLYTIPRPSSGRLVINTQTGQDGATYDASRDVARVPMQSRKLAEPVELFTIDVAEVPEGGELRLKWDRREYVVPFRVRASP